MWVRRMAYIIARKVMNIRLGQHRIVWPAVSMTSRTNYGTVNSHSNSLFRRGGVLPAMMTSLALPDRSVFNVDL